MPEYSDAPLKKRFNWQPKSLSQEESAEVQRLAAKVRLLARSKLTIIDVTAAIITRCVQPLQQRMHPLWCYNGTSDATRYKRKGPDNQAAMAAILADLFKGEEEEFALLGNRDGYSSYNPIEWVSSTFIFVVRTLHLYLMIGSSIFPNRIGGAWSRPSAALLHNQRAIPVMISQDYMTVQRHQSILRTRSFTRRVSMALRWPL